MNNKEKLFMRCMDSPLTDWADAATTPSAYPWLVYIGITNICNSRCSVCGYKAMRNEKGVMDFKIFKNIVAQLPSEVRKVYLMKQGEPFVHCELEKFILHLKKKRPDIHIAIHSNGILANEKRTSEILPLLNSFGISISAINAETYMKVHNVDKFDDVIENLHGISKFISSMPLDKRPHVFIDYIEQEGNHTETRGDVISFFKRNFPGITSVDFHWVYNFQGETLEGNLDVYDNLPQKKFPCCVFPWCSMTICYDGKVDYCFVEPREDVFLGDINEKTLIEIWNGKSYKRFRKMMVEGQYSTMLQKGFYCGKCSWLWSLRSQAPKSLTGGYTLRQDFPTPAVKFEDVLDMPVKNIAVMAMSSYIEGQIHVAYSLASYISEKKSLEKTEIQISSFIINKCRKIFKKYSNTELWRKELDKENREKRRKTTEYHKLDENNGIHVAKK